MKALKLFLLLIPFFILSCGSVEKSMQKNLDKVQIGMTIPEFKQVVKNASTVYLSEDYSCFKLKKSKAKFGEPGGYVYSTRFFYFKDGKLWKIDEGRIEKPVDYRIQVDKNIQIDSN